MKWPLLSAGMEMKTHELLEKLGYKDNQAFLQGKRLREHHGYSFFFTQAEKQEYCNLKGVYALLDSPDKLSGSSFTPVVYVCEAENEAKAEQIHQRVWNQNIVPFLIVVTPKKFRLYSGFEYDRNQIDEERVLAVAKDANEVLSKLSALKAESIDSGDIWKQRPISVEGRVDRHLLEDLKKLSEVLKGNEYHLPIEHAHTLIGKYIYLKYLRDRGILSDEQFEKAKINEDDIFGKNANKDKLYQLEKYLNGFLNGSVFPLPSGNNIRAEHIKKVASVFKGDDPKSGQQVLFDSYDFSYVPIETLSVVYQQFLHANDKGHSKGAYYTPVHLVNFILDELEAKKPLKEGMKVFDPSCGSGAFLVQCYRRLVESIIRAGKVKLNPKDLRKLLVDNIFGLDADEEACLVAELSLSLTLLDYIEPHDLRTYPTFRLPELHNKNIFHCEGGFFDECASWTESIPKQGYDWIIGNPPWKNINKKKDKEPSDCKALEWIDVNKKTCPVDNYQIAEAFAWKTTKLLKEDGQCGLLMPAMTLFKKQGYRFRAKFFSEIETWCIVNFANIRRYLFEGAINPAAAFFFSGKKDWDKVEHYIKTYAPFAVEQSGQLNQKGGAKKIWSIFVDYSTIKEIPLRAINDGSLIPWKTAMWGTHRDSKLIDLVSKHNATLEQYLNKIGVKMTEGSQLRELPEKFATQREEENFYKNHKFVDNLVNKGKINKDKLAKAIQKQKITLEFPAEAIVKIKKREAYLRIRGGENGLEVSNPPHIIIAASRNYTLYSDDYVFIPPRRIGIGGNPKQSSLLKALTLYLNSDFIHYQQLLTGEALGVKRDCVNLDSFKQIPTPFGQIPRKKILEWSKLYDEIVQAEKRERQTKEEMQGNERTLFNKHCDASSKTEVSLPKLEDLLKKVNNNVYQLLGISKKQQWLIEDMLDVRIKLNDGVFDAQEAIKPATEKEMNDFACIFQEELDLFLDRTGNKKVHKVKILYADSSTVIIVDHLTHSTISKPEIVKVQDTKIHQELDELQRRLTEIRSQWMYFIRCLRVYEKRRTYIFKPRQRLYWLKSQALAEADDFIAEKLATNK